MGKKIAHWLDRRAGGLVAAAAYLDPDQLLTTLEVADLLGHAPITIRKWRGCGIGPPWIRTGIRSVRYRRVDLVSWLMARSSQFAHEHAPKTAQRSGA